MAVLEFRCPVAGGFIMMSDTFKRVCEVLGREYSESGCLMPEDLDEAIAKIEDEIDREKILLEEIRRQEAEKDLQGQPKFMTFSEEDEEIKARERISFGMRVYSLLEMMKAARRKNKKMWWGVP